MVTTKPKILIMAGGTGGHVMPALAVAAHLQAQGVAVHWLGTQAGIEARLVPAQGIEISYVDIQGIRGKKWLSLLQAPFRIAKAFIQSLRILLQQKPQAVLTMGGYVTGPGALAAWVLRCPILLHEQNAIAGWTNRHLARFAHTIMVAFPHAFTQGRAAKKALLTGNPVRQTISTLPEPQQRELSARLKILVIGGSQGAAKLNELLPPSIALLPAQQRPEILHQSGKLTLQATQQAYFTQDIEATVTDFIDDMAQAYAWADIVICRSGALTVAELASAGVPSILIPLPHAVDDHQTANAKYLSDHGAAILCPQAELTPLKLKNLLSELIAQPERCYAMAIAAKQLAKPQATATVAQHCLEVSLYAAN